jgi:protein SCO1/2
VGGGAACRPRALPLAPTAMDTPARPSPAPARPRPALLWGAGVLVALAALGLGLGLVRPARAPEVLGALPLFRFTSEQGAPFGSPELAGQVWVANFIFTRCPTVCPVFSRKMAEVQTRSAGMGAGLHLVSFSVDPEYDTPERLAAYAQRYGAEAARWTFLTGDYQQLKDTVVGGFKMAMGKEAPAEDDLLSIFHGEHFVLVDARGRIRGYYLSSDADAVERLLTDAQWLLAHPQS